MLKFVVLSDLHLVEEGETSHGLDTYDRLAQGIDAINTRHGDAAFCVMAGDLADKGFDGAVKPYARLQELVARLTIPCHITIGNHDRRATFADSFGADVLADTGFVDKIVDAHGYRIILLDTVIEGTHGGHLDPAQLTWLADRLAEHPGPVIIVMHHHPAPLYTMVDRIILDNADALADVLTTHGDVRQIIAGHVHFTSTGLWRGLPVTTLGGSHYSVTAALTDKAAHHRLWGPAQMAVVLGDDTQTLVHFDNYMDGNPVLG